MSRCSWMIGTLALLPALGTAAVEGRPCTPEPTDMTIAYGDLITCAIDVVGDTDVFRFTGAAGDAVAITVLRRTGGGLVDPQLFDPSGDPVSSPNFFRDYRLPRAGAYTIRVSASEGTSTYTLVLERMSPPPATAVPIRFGENLTDEINPSGDLDVFVFSGSAGDRVTLRASSLGDGNLCVAILDPSGDRIDEFPGNCPSDTTARLPVGGIYVIRVSGISNAGALPYRIDLQCIGQCVTQPLTPCTYSLSPDSRVFTADGGTGTVGVFTSPGCSWTAASNTPIAVVAGGASGSGPGTVTVSVLGNTTGEARIGTMTIAGQTFTVNQTCVVPYSQASPGALDFRFREGSPRPEDRVLSLFSNVNPVGYTARFTPGSGGNWLAVTPQQGSAPSSVIASVNPAGLAPGTYRGTIVIAVEGGEPPMLMVPATLAIEAAGVPRIAVSPAAISFSFPVGGAARTAQLGVSNAGGGSLDFRATAATRTGGAWLSVSPASGSITGTTPATVVVTADPRGLAVGTYTGQVTFPGATPGSDFVVPVTLTVSAIQQTILLSQTGLTFTAVARGGAVPSQTFGVVNAGQGVMDWTVRASTIPAASGPSWLSVSPGSGMTDAASLTVPLVEVLVDPTGLDPGEYYGQVEVLSSSAANSPQTVSVVLQVLPPGSDPGPQLRPTGLIFTGIAGGAAPAPQVVLVADLTGTGRTFTSGRLTVDGALWFTNSPTDGVVAARQPTRIEVRPNTTGLAAGVRRGVLTILFADGGVRNVNLVLVLIPAAPGGASAVRFADGCRPTRLLPVFTLLGDQFNVAAGWPNPIEARVVDDCGDPMTTGSVSASFSSGDPPLSLVPLKDGRWAGTWQPRNASSAPVVVALTAEQPGGIRGTFQITGGLRANSTPPVVSAGGVAALVAPGGIVSIYGTRLAERRAEALLPLPPQLGGTTVALAGRALPLYFASDGQINAQIPYDIAVNTRHQLIVRRGNSYAVPEPVIVAPAQPSVFTLDQSGRGQGLVFGIAPDGSPFLADAARPVRAGDFVVVYCAGLGAVDQAVQAGVATPLSPLSRTSSPVTVTIQGRAARVEFAGLTPTFTGLYQVNIVVPDGVTASNAADLVLSVAGQTSPPVTLAVR